jgi:hypothetical protein
MVERWTVHAYLLHVSMDHFLSPPFGAPGEYGRVCDSD